MTTKAVKEALTEMPSQGQQPSMICIIPMVWILKEFIRQSSSKMRCYFSPTLFSSEGETTDETISRAIIEEILEYKKSKFQVMVAPHSPIQL